MNRTYYSRYEPVPALENENKIEKNSGLYGLFGNIFSNIGTDDLILLAVIFILVTDEQPDMITILALLYIFLV